ncbi:MAG TPA: M14 family metallopeptidase [Candidatus Acidoferrales bacterium]|nr:M14 family metallopeptidase [Candidatus Acidoferrales bacterium]
MIRRLLLLAFGLLLALVAAPAYAQAPAEKFEFFPGAKYDPAIPTLKQVVGHDWGEKITSHPQIERYIEALAKASPRIRIVKYAETYEGRALYYLILASEANMARIEQVKSGMQRLADPRGMSDADAEKLIAAQPPVTWITAGVHGNEISSCDAVLLLAYHLLAAQNDDTVKMIFDRTVVILDPTQNPDGRDRFITYFNQNTGPWPDADPQAAEHNENWPGGRSNHYLFDMNRDWFAQTQPETRGRTKAYLEWFPVVFVDEHEMGSNGTYYFAPPAAPYNPIMPKEQVQWLFSYGKNNSEWFDKFRFDYFTRDVYDSFYPGYGEGWPMFQGSIGMTFEQASVRGLAVKRSDDTLMLYRDSVHHHFISALSTAQNTAKNDKALLRYFYNYRKTAVQEGQQETVKEYILPPGRDANRAIKLAALLMREGIEVKRAEKPFSNARARDYYEGKPQAKEFPAGTFVILLAQPNKRLLKTLMDKNTPLPDDFVQEQIRRRKKRLGEQFYDVTGWSMPLLYGVEAYMAEQASAGNFTTLKEEPKPMGRVIGGAAHLAYLIPWGSNSAAQAAAALLRDGIRIHRADRGFTLGDVKFPAGTLVVKTKDNPSDLHARMEKIAAAYGVEVHATDRAWIEEGINLGSGNVTYVEPPKIAMAWNEPVSSTSAGWTRYVLEQQYGLRVTLIRGASLRGADLDKYNVLILPNGFGYPDRVGDAGAQNIKGWAQRGGTLIAFGEASRWLTDEKVALLATSREFRSGKPEREERPASSTGSQPVPSAAAPKPAEEKKTEAPAAPKSDFDLEKAIQPERELPDATPGAIFRVRVDTEHWLGLGYDGSATVMVDSNNIFTPLKLDRGTNVATYYPENDAMLSGFTWEATRKQTGNKAYLMHQPTGRGHVIAFAEEPNYRAFMDGLNILFLNGVLFGPSH